MSSSRPAVEVRNLWKEYRIARNRPRRTSLIDFVRGGLRFGGATERFTALRDATFEVAPGEVLGIIGHNGAGKSTLLKILSRIVEPTGGEAILRGRVGSLLEVGTGFHPDLTGRENIFLNGSMLGMSRAVVQGHFDSIVEFAGVERFLDTPVKRYSSGMHVRLAFAVAAHLDCDILIVDEVLAVGDEGFQRKCLGKMSEAVGLGRTVLFVSHNMSAVSSLAKRTMVLSQGHVVFDGDTDAAIEHYLGQGPAATTQFVAAARPNIATVTRVDIRTSQGGRIQPHGTLLEVEVEVTTPSPVVGARLYITLVNRLGRWCTQAWRFDSESPICRTAGVHRFLCRFHHLRLAPGQYVARVVLSDRRSGALDELDGLCPFEVVMYGEMRERGWPVNQVAYFDDVDWAVSELA